jgi:hypothetical protein
MLIKLIISLQYVTKDPTNSEKKLLSIYRQLRNAEPPDEETAPRGIIDKYSSLTNVTTWVK